MARRKVKKFNLHGYILGALSKIWRWWPPRKEVIDRCTRERKGKEETRCEICNKWFAVIVTKTRRGQRRKRETEVDHIEPKIDPAHGFQGWDVLIQRTFVTADKLQNACKSCHKKKTDKENKRRRLAK